MFARKYKFGWWRGHYSFTSCRTQPHHRVGYTIRGVNKILSFGSQEYGTDYFSKTRQSACLLLLAWAPQSWMLPDCFSRNWTRWNDYAAVMQLDTDRSEGVRDGYYGRVKMNLKKPLIITPYLHSVFLWKLMDCFITIVFLINGILWKTINSKRKTC